MLSLNNSAEMSNDCVSKFSSFVRAIGTLGIPEYPSDVPLGG